MSQGMKKTWQAKGDVVAPLWVGKGLVGSWGILECMTTGGFGDNDGAKRDEVRSALVDEVVK